MDNFNLDELMELAEAYVGPMIDAIYRRLIDRDFALEDPEVVMLLTALINILGHDSRGDRPTEVLLMAAYGERGVIDRPNMRVMGWRNGALSGSDLANEPGLGSSRTYQPGEIPMPSKPKPGLRRMHREMNSEATSSGSPLRAAVPPKRAKVGQKVQTNQTMQDLDEMNDELKSTKKELRLTKESMGALPKSSEYCGPIKKKSYGYVSGIIGIAYNPFLSEDIRDCFFDYEQAVLLRFWTSRIVTIKSVNNTQAKLGLVLEEEVTAPSVPKSDKRVEFGLGFSDELLRTSLMTVWELMRPSWCPSPNADSIIRATQDVQRELNADCNLRDLNIIYNVMITASKSNGEDKVELPGWGPEDWVKPGSCLAEVCGLEGHVCGGMDCVKTLEKQHKQLTVLFGNVVMKARTETELIADCHGGTDVNLVTALGFYSMFGSLESLLNLEQKHEMVTAISVEVFPGVLQTEQKYIGKWRDAIETEMNIRHSETYCRPSGARYLVGSTLAPMCKSRYPVHFVAVDVKSTRTIVDQAFSVPKCVRLARMSEKSYELLCKMLSAVPERTKEELESILGKKYMGYVSGNSSDFERQKQRGSTVTDYNTVDENDEVHRVMMEVEPLLEASGKRNWRSIMLTHDEFPCHCLLQTWWYPKRSNLMLIWDSGELLSMGLPDSSQPITIVIVGVMMAIRWLEAHVKENNRQEAPTREQLRKLDCLKDLDLFETMCKVLNIPMEVKKIWARKRLMPWFRANMTAWLYEYAKKHIMSKHGRVYSEY